MSVMPYFPSTRRPALIQGLEVSRAPEVRARIVLLVAAGAFAAGIAFGAVASSWIAQRAIAADLPSPRSNLRAISALSAP